jgi:hypothetical protein
MGRPRPKQDPARSAPHVTDVGAPARTRHKKGIAGGNPITELLVVRHDATGGEKVRLQIFDLENGLHRLVAGSALTCSTSAVRFDKWLLRYPCDI